MRFCLLFSLILWSSIGYSQNYIVNSVNDLDDGVCDAVHCSFREAVKAAEADGVASIITFGISGPGPFLISPTMSFPNILQTDLTIIGESQPSPPGSIIIDFNFRNFMGVPFWTIQASRFIISGITFREFLYENLGDHIFKIGDLGLTADNCTLRNCSFYDDNSLFPLLPKEIILVNDADNVVISNNKFATDVNISSIFKLDGYLTIDANIGTRKVSIDSNIFANKIQMIEISGGDVSINKNIFGALDTNKAVNFLVPDIGIRSLSSDKLTIHDNFFFGIQKNAILQTQSNRDVVISKNRFYNNIEDINTTSNPNSNVLLIDNTARDGRQFVTSSGNPEIYFERNNINNYDSVFTNLNDPLTRKVRHIDNRMTCINDKLIILNPALFPSHPVPVISSVNRNQITGTGNPNDSIVVYSNNRLLCPNAICQGGSELGRTQADASGNWILNATYPNRTSISAFQFINNPNTRPTIYSEFSNCYQCSGQVKINFNPSICAGQIINFRGKNYSQANPKDSIFVRGDGVSICDSVILVNVGINSNFRSSLNVAICYQDTLRFGTVEIHKDHLVDSLLLKSTAGCDSIITITGREVGLDSITQTICDNASITIFGTRFDKNNTSGVARGIGQAVSGCDSVVFVSLKINNFTEFFLNAVLCPGKDTLVQGQLFNQARPKGDVPLPGGSSTGCDSIIHVDLLYPNNIGSFSTTICPGDSVLVVNRFFSDQNPTGQIIIPNGSSFGCDTIINVAITVLPNAMGFFNAEICRGDTLILGSQREIFFSGKLTGTLRENNGAANGCDSLVRVQLSEIQDAIGKFDTVLCDQQTVTYEGETFSKSRPRGSFKILNASSRMCDSFVNVNITFIPQTIGFFSPMICSKDSIRVGNQFFSARNPTGQIPLISAAGCDSILNVSVHINPIIQAQFEPKELKCNAANTGELIINTITGGSGTFKVSIDNGPTLNFTSGQTIGNLAQGNHTIRIIDQLSCDTSFTFTINNSQSLFLQLPNDTTIKLGNAVNINASANFNPSIITWDPTLFLSCTNCLNPQSKPDQTVTYMLTLEDDKGCIIKDNMTITVLVDEADIFVPNVFSPNGDNINDFFNPVFKFPEKTSILVFRIFDRWGNMVYEKLNGAIGDPFPWDGKFQAEKLNPGVYTYAIQYAGEDKVGKWKTGDLTLLR
ncbi:MAG: gliding motility-associated C-terminal domain-containing protein [Saprospiraceae bacterium]|nr:gliding motility-associated C-terminal domain-containing protein [Saprospiraceae bacterium]